MADINQVITLGIGTPAGIPEFLTFGLQIAAIPTVDAPGLEFTIPDGLIQFTVPIELVHYTMPDED